MTKDYLDGKIDFITFGLDFPYEVETRYRKMVKEDREIVKPRCQTLSYEALSYLVGQVIKDLAKKFVRFLHY